MMGWGWVSPLPALFIAYVLGSFAYHGTLAMVERRPVFAALRGAMMIRRTGSKPFGGSKAGNAIAVVLLLVLVACLVLAFAY